MAKKELVDNIIKLYSKLGGNMNNVLGSRSNITFLGTGKNPEPFVEMSLNMESVAALGKSKVLQELESPMGYLTANKLNDIQATKLYNNMLQLEEFYYPKQTPNITDLETGTRNLDQEGLMSLRTTQALEENKPIFDKAMQGAAKESEAMRKAGLDPSNLDDYNKAEKMGIIKPRGDYMTDEGVMASETILPMRRVDDLPPPGSRGGPDDIAAPVQSAEETIKQLRIQDPDLADQVRKMVDQGIMTRGNQGAMPVKRSNAREFLVEALKKDTLDPATSGFGRTNLNDIVSAEDVKLITEGGGGIGGDPLLLVEKYFGPRIVELIPDERITPRFINRLLTNVRDDAGRAPDDPRFDRFTATLIGEDIPFAEGGRAGFRLGKSVFKGIANLFTKGDDLVEQEKIFREGPITTSFLEKVNPKVTEKFIRTRDMSGPGSFGMYDNIADMPQGLQAAEFIKKIRGPQGNVDYEKAEMFIGEGVKLTGKESVDELLQMFLNAMKSYKSPFAEGGRAGFRLGGMTNSLLKKLDTKKIKAAVDNIFETGDYKYDAELAAESLVEMNPQLFGGKLYDDLDDMIRLDVYDLVLKEVSQRNALKIQARRGKAAAAKELEQKSVLSEYKPKKFDAAKGGLAKILEV